MEILKPGEMAEDYLDEKQMTRCKVGNVISAEYIPKSVRGLIKVFDHGFETYEVVSITKLEKCY